MFMFVTPMMICFMLSYMTNIIESLRDVSMDAKPISHIGKIARCKNGTFVKPG
jgi:hypothetical protein